jgi:small-conductance mechanosensitive channel
MSLPLKNIEEALLPLYNIIVSRFNVFGWESPNFIVSHFSAFGGESPLQRIFPLFIYIITHFAGIWFGFAGKMLVFIKKMTGNCLYLDCGSM